MVQEHKSIENIIKHVDKKKHSIPENWLFEEARRLFKHPEVTPGEEIDFKWEKPDEEVRNVVITVIYFQGLHKPNLSKSFFFSFRDLSNTCVRRKVSLKIVFAMVQRN